MYEFKRYEKNPVLTVGDLPEKAGYYLLNPGAVQFRGEFLLMADVFHTEGGIVFWMARSQDGVHFAFDPKPVAMPECSDGWEENGVYDPRITEMDGQQPQRRPVPGKDQRSVLLFQPSVCRR